MNFLAVIYYFAVIYSKFKIKMEFFFANNIIMGRLAFKDRKLMVEIKIFIVLRKIGLVNNIINRQIRINNIINDKIQKNFTLKMSFFN